MTNSFVYVFIFKIFICNLFTYEVEIQNGVNKAVIIKFSVSEILVKIPNEC